MPPSKFVFVCIASAALAGCNEGIDGKHGSSPSLPSSPSSGTTLSTAPVGTTFSLAAHREVEAFNETAYVSAGIVRGQPVASPTAQVVTTSDGFSLTLPNSNIVTFHGTPDNTNVRDETLTTSFIGGPRLVYSTYGLWTEGPGAHVAPVVNSSFSGVLSYGIVATQMPVNGSATFTGTTKGFYYLPNTSGTFSGTATLVAAFAGGTIAGDLTSLATVSDLGVSGGRLSDINLTGTISGTGFSGTATPGGNASDHNLDLTGSTGTFGGQFDGPGAAELDGTFALSTGLSVAGAFAATGQTTPSGQSVPAAPNSPGSTQIVVPTLATVPTGYSFLGTYPYGVRLANGATDETQYLYNPFSVTTTASGFTFTRANENDITHQDTVTFDTSAGAADVVAAGQYFAPVQTTATPANTTYIQLAVSSLTYSSYGVWATTTTSTPARAPGLSPGQQNLGVIAYGVETPASQMPTVGTGTYTGGFRGYYSAAGSSGAVTGGAVALTADFAARTINGAVTNITTMTAVGATGRLNDLTLAGQFGATPAESASFLGTATAAAATPGVTIDVSGAGTGDFGGKFYGPNAAEIAGVVNWRGPNSLVQGAFAGRK